LSCAVLYALVSYSIAQYSVVMCCQSGTVLLPSSRLLPAGCFTELPWCRTRPRAVPVFCTVQCCSCTHSISGRYSSSCHLLMLSCHCRVVSRGLHGVQRVRAVPLPEPPLSGKRRQPGVRRDLPGPLLCPQPNTVGLEGHRVAPPSDQARGLQRVRGVPLAARVYPLALQKLHSLLKPAVDTLYKLFQPSTQTPNFIRYLSMCLPRASGVSRSRALLVVPCPAACRRSAG